jgi:acyl-CoA synthetase (NDP forming)
VASSILTPADPLWDALRDAGAPIFQDVVRMVGAVARWVDTDGPGEPAAFRHAPDASTGGAGTTWDAKEAATFLRAAGVPIPDFRIARTAEQAANQAKGLGGPTCLKVLVPDLSHKSEQGGVILGLTDAAETGRAAQTLLARFPGARLLVMRSYPPGPELFAGARTDAVYGPTLVVGRGGIWTEVEDDVALLPAGSSQAAIEEALKTLRMAPLLVGYRGQPPCDLAAVAAIASALGSAIMNRPTLFVDLNPLLLVGGKPVVVDWRVVEA